MAGRHRRRYARARKARPGSCARSSERCELTPRARVWDDRGLRAMSTPVPAADSIPLGWDARAQSRGLWLAVGVPLCAYLLSASGQSYWLDAGEFVAAAVDLDIAHPPGHPLTALWAKPFTWLPLGPIAF